MADTPTVAAEAANWLDRIVAAAITLITALGGHQAVKRWRGRDDDEIEPPKPRLSTFEAVERMDERVVPFMESLSDVTKDLLVAVDALKASQEALKSSQDTTNELLKESLKEARASKELLIAINTRGEAKK